MRLHCFKCGKIVSNEIEETVIIRGTIECPECTEKQNKITVTHRRWESKEGPNIQSIPKTKNNKKGEIKVERCTSCGAMLLDWEIDNCDGLCGDCCEEQHFEDDSICHNMNCPYTKCNANKEEI